MFDVSMLGSPPVDGYSLVLKSGPAPTKPTKKAAWDDTLIIGLQEQPEENYKAIMAAVRMAFERLKLGTATARDFDKVGSAFNVGLVRAEAIDFRAVEVMNA